MNTTVKYLVIAGALVGAYFLITKNMKKVVVTSTAANENETSNAAGCTNKCDVGSTLTSDCRCISPGKGTGQGPGSFGSGKMFSRPAAPKVSPTAASIVQRGYGV